MGSKQGTLVNRNMELDTKTRLEYARDWALENIQFPTFTVLSEWKVDNTTGTILMEGPPLEYHRKNTTRLPAVTFIEKMKTLGFEEPMWYINDQKRRCYFGLTQSGVAYIADAKPTREALRHIASLIKKGEINMPGISPMEEKLMDLVVQYTLPPEASRSVQMQNNRGDMNGHEGDENDNSGLESLHKAKKQKKHT